MLIDMGALISVNESTDTITLGAFLGVEQLTAGGGPVEASLTFNTDGSVTAGGTGSNLTDVWGRPTGALTGTYHLKWELSGTAPDVTPFAASTWTAMSTGPHKFGTTCSSSSAESRVVTLAISDDGGSTTLATGTLTLTSDDTP